MNDDATPNLGGEWHGIFSYPSRFPPNDFVAVIGDTGGTLSGTISEPDQLGLSGSSVATALLTGQRDGARVRFTKYYDVDSEHRDTVSYEGTLSPDGNEISGSWMIPGDWSGSFIMIRPAKVVAERSVERAESVGVEDRPDPDLAEPKPVWKD